MATAVAASKVKGCVKLDFSYPISFINVIQLALFLSSADNGGHLIWLWPPVSKGQESRCMLGQSLCQPPLAIDGLCCTTTPNSQHRCCHSVVDQSVV